MKVNFADKRIPIGMLAIVAITMFVLQLAGVLNSEWIDIILIFFGLFTILVYFPLLMFSVFRRKDAPKASIVISIGLLTPVFWVLGNLLKFYHLPGGAQFVFCGAAYFVLFFIPSWYHLKVNEYGGRHRLPVLAFCLFFAVMMLAGLWRNFHYPGTAFMQKLCFGLFFLGLVPAVLYMWRKGEWRDLRLKADFIFIFLFAYFVSYVQVASMRDERYSRSTASQEIVERNLRVHHSKGSFIYDALYELRDNQPEIVLARRKADSLKMATEDLLRFIRIVKTKLIVASDRVDSLRADTMRFADIASKSDYDMPTFVLLGRDHERMDGDSLLGNILRRRIEEYSKLVEQILPEESRSQFKVNNPLKIEDKDEYMDGIRLTWVKEKFLHKTLGTIFTTLTDIEAEVRHAETLAISEIFNGASANRRDDVAAQIADLSMKYEAQKSAAEIERLKREKEVGAAQMIAKDAAIEEREKTIIYFVLASVVFVLLTMVVIRANILRRRANKVLEQQKLEIERQKELVEEKQHEILDSIRYAKRLQEAILPPADFIDANLPENFIWYKPKDVVAGDFYWAERQNGRLFIAAADSTGHGVPGAMVSVVCSNALNRSVKEFGATSPGAVLDKTRELVVETFEKSASEVKDGMDISLLCIEPENGRLTWSGANNGLWYVQDGKLHELPADKQPVGKTDWPAPFSTHQVDYEPGSVFYLFTDGFADQFGGPRGKKFKYKQFADLLLSVHRLSLQEQKAAIESAFLSWKGDLEQVDDVCVIGIRLN